MSAITPILATAESAPAGPSNVGLGAVVLTLAVAVFLVWVGYLVVNSRRRTRPLETPAPNREFFLDNEHLENDRLTRVLGAAVIAAAVLAIVMPIYFVNETNRQEAAAEGLHENYVEAGKELWIRFECVACHGPEGGGGAGAIVESRSGLDAKWAAPSINDVFLRYDEEEVRHWIVNGRRGTPMPPAGLEGGGSMTVQEIDQVVTFLRSIQLPQMEAFAKVDDAIQTALDRVAGGTAAVEARLVVENAKLDDIHDAPQKFEVLRDMPDKTALALSVAGSCTTASAALVGATCSNPGPDADRDGLTDQAEAALVALADQAMATVTTRKVDTATLEVSTVNDTGFELTLSPSSGFSMTDATGNPVPDLDSAESFLSHLNAKHLEFSLLADRNDQFASAVIDGIAFLEAALDRRAWEVDFGQVAADTGLSEPEAERAVGLFNSYCARCHTAGYSAGVEFEQEPGTGAWAPALADGRAVVQFPAEEDHINFVIQGTTASTPYGVNGLSGVGGMPGFGALLSEEDIALIVKYERSL